MKPNRLLRVAQGILVTGVVATLVQLPGAAQGPQGGPPGGPGGRGGFGGPGPGGMGQQEQALVKQFDKDGDKRLNAAERQAAFAFLQGQGGGRGGFGGRGMRGGGNTTGTA